MLCIQNESIFGRTRLALTSVYQIIFLLLCVFAKIFSRYVLLFIQGTLFASKLYGLEKEV